MSSQISTKKSNGRKSLTLKKTYSIKWYLISVIVQSNPTHFFKLNPLLSTDLMNPSPIPLTQSQLLCSLNMDAKKGPAKNEVCYHFINETVKFVVENYNVLTMLEIWVSSLFQNIT